MKQTSELTRELARKQELKAQQATVSIIVSTKHGLPVVTADLVCATLEDALQIARALANHIDDEIKLMEESRDGYADPQSAV